jgi:hypothetical protein
LIPWHISRRTVGRRRVAWRLTIRLLPRLSDAIWAALRRLVE